MAPPNTSSSELILQTQHIVRPAQGMDTSQSAQLAGVVERDAFVYLSTWINSIIKVKVSPDTLRTTVGVIPGLSTAMGAYDLVCDIVDLGSYDEASKEWGYKLIGNWVSTTIDVVGLIPVAGGVVKGFKPAMRMMMDPKFAIHHLRDHLAAIGQGEALVWLEKMVAEELPKYPGLVNGKFNTVVGGLQGNLHQFAQQPGVKLVNAAFGVFGPSPVERVDGLLGDIKQKGPEFVHDAIFGCGKFPGFIPLGKKMLTKGRSQGSVPGNLPPRPAPKSESETRQTPRNATTNAENKAPRPQTEHIAGRHPAATGPQSAVAPQDCGCQGTATPAKSSKTKKPVVIATGEEVLYQEDFSVPGLFPVEFIRGYRSSHQPYDDGILGARWTTAYTTAISETATGLVYHDFMGRNVVLPPLQVGESHDAAFESFILRRDSASTLTLVYRNGDTDHFRAQDGVRRYVLVRKARRNGPCLHILPPAEIRAQLGAHPALAHLDPAALLVITDGRSLWLECLPADESCLASHSPALSQSRSELDALHRANQQAGLAYLAGAGAASAPGHWRQALARRIGRIEQLLPDASRHTHVRYTYAPALDPQGCLRPGILELVSQQNVLGHARHYAYTQVAPGDRYPGACHLLLRYTDYSADGSGFGQNLEWEGHAAWAPYGTGPEHPFSTRCVRTVADDGSDDTRLIHRPSMYETEVIDAVGTARVYQYNGQYLICGLETRYPDGSSSFAQRIWNFTGQPVKDIDPEGRTSYYSYDDRGNLLTLTDPGGATTRYAYDADNNPISITEPGGQVWLNRYDSQGNLLAQTDPLGHTTAYAYDEAGQLVGITDAKGGRKQLRYNPAGQLVSHTDCSGKTTRYSYNALGHLIASTDAAGHVTRYETDKLGRVSAVQQADGSREQYDYDAADRLTQRTDLLGHVSRYAYNGEGQLIRQTDPLGHSLGYRYDAAMRLIALVNQNGEQSEFLYDAQDNLVRETGFDGKAHDYTYDLSGQLIQAREGKTQLDYERDSQGRLLRKTARRPHSPHVVSSSYRYDSQGRMIGAENDQVRLSWQYDASGRLQEETQHLKLRQGGVTHERVFILKHELDALGNRIVTTLPNGRRLDTQRYGSGHWLGSLWNGQSIVDVERDELHRETERQMGRQERGRLQRKMGYDPLSRLSQQWLGGPGGETLSQRRQGYDAAGNLIRIEDRHRGRIDYRYDALGQLTGARQKGLEERFAFDPAGNLTDGSPQGRPRMANRKGQDHGHWSEGLEQLEAQPEEARLPKLAPVTQNLLKHYLQESYEHDGEGNTIRKVHRGGKGEQPYTLNLHYDAENRLVKAVRPGRAGSVEAEYSYDPLGRRIAKRVREYAPVRGTGTHGPAAELACQAERLTLFVWDGDRLVQEIQANQTVSYLYEPESFIPLAQVISDTPDTVYGPEAVRARQLREAEREASQTEVAAKLAWLEVADRKAWTLARSGEEERKREEERTEREIREREGSRDRIYYLHGDHLGTPQEAVGEDGGVVWQAAYKAWGRIHRLEKGAISQPFRFQGQYEDEETGLYYNRHRYYDPDTARYLTQDPIGLAGGENLYRYTLNPTLWTDPLGLKYVSGNRSPSVVSGKDKTNASTQMLSEWRRKICRSNIGAERNKFLGDNFVKVGEGKWRSLDGTRQFRITPSDYNGAHGMGNPSVPNTPHVHFEFLTPKIQNGQATGNFTVTKNIHVPLVCP